MAKRLRRTNRQESEVIEFQSYRHEYVASNDGPQVRKHFSVQDLAVVRPKTEHQAEAFHVWNDPKKTCMVLIGPAGVGKDFISLYMALRDVLDKDTPYEKIVIIRSTVAVRTSGFLPGTQEEKLAPFEAPYVSIFDELFPWKKSYDNLKALGKVEFHSTEFLRGITLNNCIVLFDEFQCNTYEELTTVCTRLGKDSKLILCGDYKQNDLIIKKNDQSGYIPFMNVIKNMKSVGIVEFGIEDIVRSGFVKEFLTQEFLLTHE